MASVTLRNHHLFKRLTDQLIISERLTFIICFHMIYLVLHVTWTPEFVSTMIQIYIEHRYILHLVMNLQQFNPLPSLPKCVLNWIMKLTDENGAHPGFWFDRKQKYVKAIDTLLAILWVHKIIYNTSTCKCLKLQHNYNVM